VLAKLTWTDRSELSGIKTSVLVVRYVVSFSRKRILKENAFSISAFTLTLIEALHFNYLLSNYLMILS